MLKMTPMSTADFERFRASSAADYVEQCRLTGLPSLAASQAGTLAGLDALLPQGPATPGHYLMLLQEQEHGATVGMMWFGEVSNDDATSAFLYDLWIAPAWRRRGFAAAALALLAEEARLRGLDSLNLNVFAHNTAAQALYRKAGFVASEITMVREL
ncbi:GNAT family N-acetyltransferase [Herbaspirillum sp. NPDC101397]|uniref:GNAT family N-acetyltransferase n=1 Tax=Herbaspirillum sp. NPDC101397 TaxID=3364006 RepID=UPI00383BA949